ncbi:MAG: hypothetical protein IPK10_01750 [Bacteroidetes bacterium]|nr:hypothetical protein [Bacteroidota bacterium]
MWTNASNWTPSGVPSSADDITIPSTPRIPIVNDHVTLNGLNLSTNAQIDFNGFDVTVTNSFTSNAGSVIQLRGRKLTINGIANFFAEHLMRMFQDLKLLFLVTIRFLEMDPAGQR